MITKGLKIAAKAAGKTHPVLTAIDTAVTVYGIYKKIKDSQKKG